MESSLTLQPQRSDRDERPGSRSRCLLDFLDGSPADWSERENARLAEAIVHRVVKL